MPYEGIVEPGGEETVAEETTTTEVVEEAPAAEVTEETETAETTEEVVEEEQPPVELTIDQRVEQWGGVERIEKALQIDEALKTTDGVIQLFIEAGKSLGVGIDKLEALFGEEAVEAAAETETVEDEDDDRVLTVKEWRELQRQEQERQQQTAQQADRERAEAAARDALSSELTTLGVDVANKDVVEDILRRGDKHLADGELDPEKVRAAVRKGHEEYVAHVKREAQRYLQSKVETEEQVPETIGSGDAPGGDQLPEPQNLEESFKRARRRLGV